MLDHIDEFFSYSFSDEESKILPQEHFENGQFEIFLPTKYKTNPHEKGEWSLNWMIERHSEFFIYYHAPFSEYKITLGLRFLDYHYQKYIDKYGNGLDFLIYIQENIDILTDGKEARKKIFLYWIEEKKKECTPLALQDKDLDELKKLKSIKINEMNKPKLTQVQISILFRLMKDDNEYSDESVPVIPEQSVPPFSRWIAGLKLNIFLRFRFS